MNFSAMKSRIADSGRGSSAAGRDQSRAGSAIRSAHEGQDVGSGKGSSSQGSDRAAKSHASVSDVLPRSGGLGMANRWIGLGAVVLQRGTMVWVSMLWKCSTDQLRFGFSRRRSRRHRAEGNNRWELSTWRERWRDEPSESRRMWSQR